MYTLYWKTSAEMKVTVMFLHSEVISKYILVQNQDGQLLLLLLLLLLLF